MRPDLHLLCCSILSLGAASCLTPDGYYRHAGGAGGATTATGGTTGAAGARATGGSTGTGGIVATGGTTGTGGIVATGGATGTGGTRATGGATGAAGTTGTGGIVATGGSTGSGGVSGATLLTDNFESGAAQWLTSGAGTATVTTDGSSVYDLADPMSKVFLAAAGDVSWTNVIVQARVKILSWAGSSSSDYAGLCARLADVDDYTCITLRGDTKVGLRADVAGSSSSVGSSVTANLVTGTWYAVTLEIDGSTVTGSLDGTMVVPKAGDPVATAASATGGVALVVDNAEAEFDDVKVTVP